MSTSNPCSRRYPVLHMFYTRSVISSNMSMCMHPSQLVSWQQSSTIKHCSMFQSWPSLAQRQISNLTWTWPNLKFNNRKKYYPKTLWGFIGLILTILKCGSSMVALHCKMVYRCGIIRPIWLLIIF